MGEIILLNRCRTFLYGVLASLSKVFPLTTCMTFTSSDVILDLCVSTFRTIHHMVVFVYSIGVGHFLYGVLASLSKVFPLTTCMMFAHLVTHFWTWSFRLFVSYIT